MGQRFVMLCALALCGAAMLAFGLWALRSHVAELAFEGQYERQVVWQASRSHQLDGQTIFIGDSLTAGLATSELAEKSENFGIPGDMIERLSSRLDRYDLSDANTIVLQIGINDWPNNRMANFGENYRLLVAKFPKYTRLIAVSLTPSNPDRAPQHAANYNFEMLRTNQFIERFCASMPNYQYLDLAAMLTDQHGSLRPAFDYGDGVHLSHAGYDVWRELYLAKINPPSSPLPPSRGAAGGP